MERPAAIVWFERCYLGAFAVKVVVAILNWSTAGSNTLQLGIIISLLLWYGVVYQHSVVSRWIIVILFVASTIGTFLLNPFATYPVGSAALVIVATISNAAATWMLMTPGAGGWFEKPASGEAA
ncbi:MAG: hypothetical protein WDN24_16570 [Sphingomonas sp.]